MSFLDNHKKEVEILVLIIQSHKESSNIKWWVVKMVHIRNNGLQLQFFPPNFKKAVE